jgi:peptidoglycan/LPS O-acetylase OafA/YrhL
MYYSIQYLRALAAVLVVITHISHKLDVNSYNFIGDFSIGAYGVDLFFIISGFIMTHTIMGKPNNPILFLSARFKRIFPL